MAHPNRARLVALGVVVLATVAILRCTPTAFDPSVHTFGLYNLCLRRLSDACVALDGGCSSVAASTSSVTLGEDPDGGFLWSRQGLAPIRGTRVGLRFQLSTTEKQVATLCGCPADVTETIRGELSTERVAASACTGDLDAGCGDRSAAPEFFDGGLPDGSWLSEADGGTESAPEPYGSFRASVVDDATASDAKAHCPCLPCRVEYEVQGSE